MINLFILGKGFVGTHLYNSFKADDHFHLNITNFAEVNYFDEITSYYTLQSNDNEINKEDSIYVKFSKTAKTMYNIYVDYDNNEKFDILNDMILNMNSNENTKIILGYIIYTNIFNNNAKKYNKLFFNNKGVARDTIVVSIPLDFLWTVQRINIHEKESKSSIKDLKYST